MDLNKFAAGAVAEQLEAATEKVFANIVDPNTEAKKPRKLVLEIVFKPSESDRSDVEVSATVKTTLQPRRAISSRMIVEANGDTVLAEEWKNAMRGQMEIPETHEEGVIDFQSRKAE